ncbi:nitroreductase [Methanocella sp. CWC-04]|uniref:Nitroreductase n=1 Tax=Methanooceanicella nereidis TaxID=2052831 RepID=A0AAP2R9I6_9EURY|nr:nitroreductase [Methanocella sp. CWC-04]
MNDVFLNIYMRRSVREYKERDIPDDIIKGLIKVATYAPSGMNRQPWRFAVIKNKALIKKYSAIAKNRWLENVKAPSLPEEMELARKMKDPGFDIFYNAPVLVLVFADPGSYTPEYDCALAAENMMLAARSLDIGSCWIGLASFLDKDMEVRNELGIAEGYRLIAPLIFGYPVENEKKAPPRKEDVIIKWID